jgi:hypothetical protein
MRWEIEIYLYRAFPGELGRMIAEAGARDAAWWSLQRVD